MQDRAHGRGRLARRAPWLAAALAALALPGAAAARDAEPRSLSVVGRAEVRVAPDRAVAMISVTTRDRTADAASRENAGRSQAVLAAVRRHLAPGDRAETLSYRIQPVYEYPRGGPRKLVAYEVVNALRVQTGALDRVGAIFDAASAAADVSVDSLQYELSDPNTAQAEALRLAAVAARMRAAKMAEGIGASLRRVRTVRERADTSPPPRPYVATREAALQAADATPVLTQELVVSAEVEVTYDIE